MVSEVTWGSREGNEGQPLWEGGSGWQQLFLHISKHLKTIWWGNEEGSGQFSLSLIVGVFFSSSLWVWTQQATRNPTATAVFLGIGVKAKTDMLYLLAEKQQPKIPVYTEGGWPGSWGISALIQELVKCNFMGQTLPTDLLHTQIQGVDVPVTHWDAANTRLALGEKCKRNPEMLALTPFFMVHPYQSCRGSLLCSFPTPLSLTPLTEKQTPVGGCDVPGCWLCPQAPSHCPSLPFCIHGVSSVCKLFGAATACLHMALTDTILGWPQGTIRINVNNNNSDKQHQH